MTDAVTLTLALAGAVVALWTAAGLWAVVRGLSMQRSAAFAARRAEQLAAMIEGAPAIPLMIRPDGSIEGSSAAARLFGLTRMPTHLPDLLGVRDDPAANAAHKDIELARQAGQSIRRVIKREGRSLQLQALPAPPQLNAPGSAILWVSDASEQEGELARARTQREEALAAFESLASLIEAAPFPMWFRDARYGIALVNQAYVNAAEAGSAADVIDQQIELIEPANGVSARQAAQRAFEGGQPNWRTVPVTVAGKRRAMDVVDVPIGDIGVAGYAIDRQPLEDLRGEFRRFADARRQMLDQLSAAVAEFGPDRSLTFVNRPFLRLFGLDEEWASANPIFERVLDRLRDQGKTPEVRDFPGWRAERRGWFAAPQPIEESWLLRDGTHLRAIGHPGPSGGLLLLFEDRTEELRLAASRDTLLRVRTATFDNLFEAVAVFAPDGRLHLWNQRFRRLWDLPDEYLSAHPRIDVLLDKVAHHLANPGQSGVLRQMVIGATGERLQRSGRMGFADGRQFDFSAIPLPDGNALLTLIDVTDSRRIEMALRERTEALEAADRVKTDFLSRISYELRTPLTSISGFAEMLEGGYAGDLPDAARGYVKAIMDATALLGRQIDTVLDLAQTEAGTLPLERRAVSLIALLHEAAEAARPEAERAGIELVAEIHPSLGQISGDIKRLRQVVDQLLAVAQAGFQRQGDAPAVPRRIILHGDGNREQARIIVSDNGAGQPVEAGQAVGMALARQLIEAHDGSFSTILQPNEGAMTTILLPR